MAAGRSPMRGIDLQLVTTVDSSPLLMLVAVDIQALFSLHPSSPLFLPRRPSSCILLFICSGSFLHIPPVRIIPIIHRGPIFLTHISVFFFFGTVSKFSTCFLFVSFLYLFRLPLWVQVYGIVFVCHGVCVRRRVFQSSQIFWQIEKSPPSFHP